MLFKKWINDLGREVYVTKTDNGLFTHNGSVSPITERTLEIGGFREINVEDLYILNGVYNEDIVIPESAKRLHVVGKVDIYGSLLLDGDSISIDGDTLAINNSNSKKPLIGKLEGMNPQITLNLRRLEGVTKNPLFLFGAYGQVPLDPEEITKDVAMFSVFYKKETVPGEIKLDDNGEYAFFEDIQKEEEPFEEVYEQVTTVSMKDYVLRNKEVYAVRIDHYNTKILGEQYPSLDLEVGSWVVEYAETEEAFVVRHGEFMMYAIPLDTPEDIVKQFKITNGTTKARYNSPEEVIDFLIGNEEKPAVNESKTNDNSTIVLNDYILHDRHVYAVRITDSNIKAFTAISKRKEFRIGNWYVEDAGTEAVEVWSHMDFMNAAKPYDMTQEEHKYYAAVSTNVKSKYDTPDDILEEIRSK